jgi:hypothetical protein
MSDIRRSRINLLINDSFRTTSALTGIISVLGKSPTGGDVRGNDCNRVCRSVARPSGRAQPDRIRRDQFGVAFWAGWGARVMILPVVDLYKAKGVTAMLRARLHANSQSVAAHANISSRMDSPRGFRCMSAIADPRGPRSAAHALPMKQAPRVRRGAPREQG